MNGPVWFFYHIPKTGGQTIRNHLRAALGTGTHVHLGRWQLHDELRGAEQLAETDTGQVRALTGHGVRRSLGELFVGREVVEVIVLRDPVERIISHWRWKAWDQSRRGRRPITFGDFVRGMQANPMLRAIGQYVGEPRQGRQLDAALYAIEQMSVVMVVEDLDEALPDVLRLIGLPAVVPVRANRTGVEVPAIELPADADLDALRRANAYDEVAYRAARDRSRRTLRTLRVSESEDLRTLRPPGPTSRTSTIETVG